jgi:hypothetical protein
MNRLTDEELERLLRETFADKEKLVDTLPLATMRRRPLVPVLLAAAAVLVVLGGILYGVNRGRDVDPVAVPPASAQPNDEDAQIWATAVTAITTQFQSRYDVQLVVMHEQTSPPADLEIVPTGESNSGPQGGTGSATIAQPFSAMQMDEIADQVGTATRAQVRFLTPGSSAGTIQLMCDAKQATVLVGNVVDNGGHKEVRTRFSYSCGPDYVITYRVAKLADTWTATGLAGSGAGTWPATQNCVLTGTTPASPPTQC